MMRWLTHTPILGTSFAPDEDLVVVLLPDFSIGERHAHQEDDREREEN